MSENINRSKSQHCSDTRTGRICSDCKVSRPAPGEPFTWNDDEQEEQTAPE